jgi:surface antigen
MASRRENCAARGLVSAGLLLALLLIGSLALGAAAEPAAAQAKARIVTASATLSGKGQLVLRGRVTQPKPHWRIAIERREGNAAGGQRWVRLPGSSRITRRGRFQMQVHLPASKAVVRPLVISEGRALARGEAIRVSTSSSLSPSEADSPEATPRWQLLPGEKMSSGEQLVSPNNLYRLVMQGDGNLVFYKGSSALWSSGTQGNAGAYAIMQPDGNLVVYAGGSAKWHSHTNGFSGARLELQDDSNLVVYHADHPIWDRRSGYLGNLLRQGWTLSPGAFLLSPDRQYRLVMQSDGNLVLYKGSSVLWNSETHDNPGAYAIVQPDGNLVVYAGGSAKWHTHSSGFPGAQLVLQNDSNLVVYHAGHPLWDRYSGYLGNWLRQGWTLSPGAFLLSPDRQYRLVMQPDGNLVLYKGASALWSSGTQGNAGAYAVMQPDGNLVVYAGGIAKWDSDTNGFPGAQLVLQNDSNLVIYHAGTAIWDRTRGLLGPSGIVEGQWPGAFGPALAHERYGYPYPNPPTCGCEFDIWRFYPGQCTSWVSYRLNQLNAVSFHNFYGGRRWGHAFEWGSAAQALGIPVNGTPALGSVAWYASNHVAYVEQVFSPTEVLVSDMNYDDKNGFRIRRISTSADWPTGFIHIKDR